MSRTDEMTAISPPKAPKVKRSPRRGKRVRIPLRNIFYSFIAAFVICAAMSRGVFQLYFPKDLSYFLSVVGFGLFIASGFVGFRLLNSASSVYCLWGANAILAAIALLWTGANGREIIPLYLLFYMATPIMLLWSLVARNPIEQWVSWRAVVAVCGWYMVIWALLEILRVIIMPGSWFHQGMVRPAGPTGSKQHFSIAMGILSVMSLQLFIWYRAPIQLINFIIFSGITVWSLTRSGILILAVSLGLSVFLIDAKWRLRLLMGAIVAVVSLGAFLVSTESGWVYIDRIYSIVDTQSLSNSVRLERFAYYLDLWVNGSILIGDHFGEFSQVTGRVLGADLNVTESSITMTLLNTGLLGLIAYYFPFWMLFRYVWLRGRLLSILIIACVVQSAVYMSVECVPYIVLLGLLPVIARNCSGTFRGIVSKGF